MANHHSQQKGHRPTLYNYIHQNDQQATNLANLNRQPLYYQGGCNSTTDYHGQYGYYNNNMTHQSPNYCDQTSAYNNFYSQNPQQTQPTFSPPNQKRKLMTKDKKEDLVSPKDCFPVSSGTQHKQNAEGYIPKRAPIPADVMSKLALAKSKLESLPNDPHVQAQLNTAMMEYHMYQSDKTSAHENDIDVARRKTGYSGPGLFTGQHLVEPMTKDEIDSDDIRTFARPDMFMNLKPLQENYGKSLMKKYGWKEGKPLGTTGAGSLAPIEVAVKTDRKGLTNDMEYAMKKPQGLAKNEGPAWICKVVNTKNPICGISELHQAMGLPTPTFKLVSENNADFKWKVQTNWGTFTPLTSTRNKKLAKSECAYQAIKEILIGESEQLGLEPPTEADNSSFLCAVFIPSNKTLGGHKMLYKHFYKSGILQNVEDHPGYNRHVGQYQSELHDSSTCQVNVDNAAEKPGQAMHEILQTGANWIIKYVNGKNASHALLDLSLSQNKPRPEEYSQYIGGSNVATISTQWGTFTHSTGCKSRKEARLLVSYQAIKEIMKNEAAKFKAKPPIEQAGSDENSLLFSPDIS